MITNADGTTEVDRVRAQTNPDVLKDNDERIEEKIRFYATQPPEVISRRLQELEREWDIERWLETNASALALSGLILSVVSSRKWLILCVGVLGIVLQHALRGWSAPMPAMRKMGLRTRGEIDREKYALKFLRGDFTSITGDLEQLRRNPASEVLSAVSS